MTRKPETLTSGNDDAKSASQTGDVTPSKTVVDEFDADDIIGCRCGDVVALATFDDVVLFASLSSQRSKPVAVK